MIHAISNVLIDHKFMCYQLIIQACLIMRNVTVFHCVWKQSFTEIFYMIFVISLWIIERCENNEIGKIGNALDMVRRMELKIEQLSLVANRISALPARFLQGLEVSFGSGMNLVCLLLTRSDFYLVDLCREYCS